MISKAGERTNWNSSAWRFSPVGRGPKVDWAGERESRQVAFAKERDRWQVPNGSGKVSIGEPTDQGHGVDPWPQASNHDCQGWRGLTDRPGTESFRRHDCQTEDGRQQPCIQQRSSTGPRNHAGAARLLENGSASQEGEERLTTQWPGRSQKTNLFCSARGHDSCVLPQERGRSRYGGGLDCFGCRKTSAP